MKKIFTILAAVIITATLLLPQSGKSQAPEGISYQAVIRNNSNELVANKQIGIRISIQKYTLGIPPKYTNVYVETHKPTTNDNGLVSIQIGGGSIVGGTFKTINWGDGTYYIQTETDPVGGTNYSISGKSQILSVPYALHAQTVENIVTDATLDGKGSTEVPLKISQQAAEKDQVLQWDGTSWKPGTKLYKRLAYIYFYTDDGGSLFIPESELELLSDETISDIIIITLEVGWNPNQGQSAPREYRSLKDGISYEIHLQDPRGIKINFPDKYEYWLQSGRLVYMVW